MRKVLLALAALLLTAAPASAIPDGGAGANTPGANASVSPRSLSAGQTIHFTISGFPAGEVVYIKIDDGNFCSQKGVHGACVVHQQRLSGSGSASGSFTLPGDLAAGAHWLRFLASEEMTDAQGNYLGVKGYTTRKGADFTVVRSSGTTGDTGGSETTGSTGSTGSGGATGSGDSGAQALAAGEVLTVRPTATPAGTPPQAPAESPEPTPSATVSPQTATDSTDAGPVSAEPASRFPIVGTVGLVVLLALSAFLAFRFRRRA
ncbi:hypothetical protein [Nocardioides sp.]|uniref:hypothetical protein n=1 Tax=Nocardioides sp. TaxID=35761 RepID=UPI0039E54B61